MTGKKIAKEKLKTKKQRTTENNNKQTTTKKQLWSVTERETRSCQTQKQVPWTRAKFPSNSNAMNESALLQRINPVCPNSAKLNN